ncbi:MAG: hypothetical protein ABW080_12855 [Candidatus Thiodiazotropha sp.]
MFFIKFAHLNRSLGVRRIFFGILAGFTFLHMPASADSQIPMAELRAEEAKLFRIFLGRPLTESELDAVSAEFIALFSEKGCGKKCAETLAWNRKLIAQIEARPGSPTALLTRHLFVQASYFSEQQQGSRIQRLLAEPDPIRIVNRENGRLMTQRDVVALANLSTLAKTGHLPQSAWPAVKIDEIVAHLDALVGTAPNSEHLHMPPLWAIAAPFWAGVKQLWPKLSAAQRQEIRKAIAQPIDVTPSVSLLAAILELSPQDAKELHANYMMENSSARMTRTMLLAVRAAAGYTTTMTIINGMHGEFGNTR